MRSEKGRRYLAALAPVAVAIGLVLWFVLAGPFAETKMDRAYRECRACGLSDSAIDGRVTSMRALDADRDGLLRQYKATHLAGVEGPVCALRIVALVDAATETPG